MASINKAIIIGNLGRDPESRQSQGGIAIATFPVATTHAHRDANGNIEKETEWHRVSLFGRLAEIAKDYLHKGSLVYIEGHLRTRKYQAKDGTDRYTTEIVGEALQLLDRRQSDQQSADDGFEGAPRSDAPPAPAPMQQSDDEDCPF